MKCKAVLKEVEELELNAPFSAEADAHLLSCESCRSFAKERRALRLLVGSLDSVSAPADFDWRLRARLAESRNEREQRRRWLPGFAPGAQAITVAASVTLLLVAIVVYRQTTATRADETQSARVAATNIRDSARADVPTPTIVDSVDAAPASGPSQKSVSSETARTRNVKNAKTNAERTEMAAGSTQPQRVISTDFGLRSAEDVATKRPGTSSTDAGPVISVRVPSPGSAQLRLEDGQGTRRTLSPVNFGGQELIERPDKARLVPASEKGIW